MTTQSSARATRARPAIRVAARGRYAASPPLLTGPRAAKRRAGGPRSNFRRRPAVPALAGSDRPRYQAVPRLRSDSEAGSAAAQNAKAAVF